MALSSGTKLGPYEIQSPLGAGGMGEVYRARDTRLERVVAIKILPLHLSDNAEARQRFDREARAISSLSHPNICTLYDVGHQDGMNYLVMEFLQGETLADRLMKGPLPLGQVLKYGIEICEGLEKAHRSGVVHRDLKPGNIMLTKAGAKLMDFGLAKAVSSEKPPSSGLTATLMAAEGSHPVTAQGTVVGTFQYMSPEQLEGKEADVRGDIFALGAVLYEMATGRRAFTGKSHASIVAAILASEPQPISVVQPMSPPALDHVVKTCLEKDPEDRFQTVHDLKLQLKWIAEDGSQTGAPARIPGPKKNRERFLAALAVAGLLATVVLGVLYWGHTPEKPQVVRSYLRAMPNSTFFLTGQAASGFAISPDGLRLAYVARSAEGKSVLWVRPLDSLQAQPLAGTEDAGFPFWSPDSREIGFFAEGKLKKIDASGGPPLTLCDAPVGRGGTWNQNGVIVFAPSVNVPLHRVSAAGGTAIPVTTLDPAKGVVTQRWPFFLPDGRHFLYVMGTPAGPSDSSSNSIMLGSLDSKENKFLLRAHAGALYASGHILFLRQNTLMAQPFDAKGMELSGDPFPIADSVQEEELTLRSIFSVSRNGMLAYLEAASAAKRELAWMNRSGQKATGVLGTDAYTTARISPDGKRLVYVTNVPTYSIWTYDILRGVKTRLTFEAAGQGALGPTWSPDGKRIAFVSVGNGKFGFYEKSADGSGNEKLLLEDTEVMYPNDWSPDGKFLTFQKIVHGHFAVWILPLNGGKPYPLLPESQGSAVTSVFSPDGKWLAYCSAASGEQQVYVIPFPGPGGKWQVSSTGGCYPRWRSNQKELFYLSSDNKMMAAEVQTSGSSFAIGAVNPLFEAQLYRTVISGYDITPDGQRFIVVYDPGQPNASIALVQNWNAELNK